MGQLFRIKGFLPYLVIVFLNAFTDLGHKVIVQNAVFKYYSGATQIFLTATVNALILLPFIMLFSPAGYCSDKYPKDKVIKLSAFFAVVLTICITASYYAGWFTMAFSLTFLLAVQSAFYSPAKYGYIKELTGKENLAGANSLVQAVTIVAILLGGLVYSLLFEWFINQDFASLVDILHSIAPVGFFLVVTAVIEALLAFKLPRKREPNRELVFYARKYVAGHYLRENLKAVKGHEVIWLCIVGLAIFWGINQVVLAAFGAFLKQAANVNNVVIANGLLAVGGMGVIVGSLIAGRVSRNYIETGLIPAGALGITVGLFVIPTLVSPGALGIVLFFYGMVGGMYIVPLNSLIQFNAHEKSLGKILAANNFIQNGVMLFFLFVTMLFTVYGMGYRFLFYMLCFVALCGTVYTFRRLPQSFIRYIVGTVVSQFYRLHVSGLDHMPSSGGVLMLGNHTSYLDWAAVQMACPRRIRFIMARSIYEKWYLKKFLNFFGVVPISAGGSKTALHTVNELLKQGEVVVLFPEGAISRNGQLGVFHKGFEVAAKETDAVIVPFYIRGLWGSIYSFATSKYRQASRQKRTRHVTVCFGSAMKNDASAAAVKKAVIELSVSAWQQHTGELAPLHLQWLKTAKAMKQAVSVTDFDGSLITHERLMTAAILFGREIKSRTVGQQNIGLLIPTSSGGVIANLAVLMLGKTVVNLNYTASLQNLVSALDQAEIRTIVTSERFLTKLKAKGLSVDNLLADRSILYLEELQAGLSLKDRIITVMMVKLLPAALLKVLYWKKVPLDSTAAILFSSGSEGTPKGVMLTHRNIIGNIKQIASVFNLRDDDVIFNTLPLFHAFGLTVTSLLPLVEGVPMVCNPDPTNVSAVGKLTARFRATILCGTSTFLRLYTRSPKLHPLMFESLRIVVAGAEKLSAEVRESFKSKFGLTIFEGYGATETGPVASVNVPDVLVPDSWVVQQGHKPGTVGLPLPGTAFRIVDPASLEAVPPGEAGLILIGGIQVMAGYLKNEKRTDEVIINDGGIRWYKTGDKGALDEDGFLSIIDRYSRFAKIGGEMVSLGAVEDAITRIIDDEGTEIAAVAVPDEKKGEKIVLIFSGDIVGAVLKQKLLEHGMDPLMLPGAFLKVEAIPKLGSGKTDVARTRTLVLRGAGG